MKFETKTIHAGVHPDPQTGAVMTPIYQTSTYAQEAPGVHKGYEYARTKNPTRTVLENNLAALENGKYGICFSSGMAAMDTIFKLLEPGAEVVSTNDLYGGSYRLMTKIYQKYGIKSTFINLQDEQALMDSINENTRLIWVETPTNPLLNIIDIERITAIAKARNILVCVDNTFASPYLQAPIDLGADLVLHSVTKYLGGHSDVVMGALVTNNQEIAEQLYFLQNAAGAVPGPQDCFLTLRGIKTLHLRVERACQNAHIIAEHLKGHPKIGKVFYPGFTDHPGHEIAKRQMRHFGGMVSFDLQSDNMEEAKAIMSNTKVFTLAESLGGVESLIGHPPSMTHGSIPRAERLKAGMKDTLIRLSVGVENVEDLIQDLDNALGA
jgi:cystathionine beta-lyase/cystathionine gamma-synthase